MRTVRGFFFSIVIAALVVGVSSLPALADEEADARTFEAERALAEKQAEDPEVAAWRALIQPDLDHVLGTAFLRCARRELYSRRAIPDLVLALEADGTISTATVKIVNRMGVCFAGALSGARLPAPPSPVRISIASPATQ